MGSGALGKAGRVMHDFSPVSGYCVECAMPRETPEPCEPSTDDSAQEIGELRDRQAAGVISAYCVRSTAIALAS